MKTRQYGKEVLELVKMGLPDLYNKHIKGRRAKFIEEHKSVGREICNEEKVGYVTQDLRLLWSLGHLFHQIATDSGVFTELKQLDSSMEVCQTIVDISSGCISTTCNALFWINILHCKKTDFFLCIQPDWSITKNMNASMPPDLFEQAKNCIASQLFLLIQRQIVIMMFATDEKSKIWLEKR